MALFAHHGQTEFGVGDRIRVIQLIKEGEKTRSQAFDGVVLAIRGKDENKTFTVRHIGAGQIGIERIFPISAPNLQKIEVLRKGVKGTRRAKLYFLRYKARREVEKIYSRALRKEEQKSINRAKGNVSIKGKTLTKIKSKRVKKTKTS